MSRKISFGGIFAGLSIVLLYAAAVMPTMKLTLFTLSGLPIALILVESGVGASFAGYLAVSVLSFLLIGNINGILPFILFFGHYGILKYFIERHRSAFVEVLLKLIVFNASIALAYFLYTKLLMIDVLSAFNGFGIYPVYVVLLLQPIFFIYDYVFSRLIQYYLQVIKR